MKDRRDFLRFAAGSLGGAMLTSCGSGGGGDTGGGPPAPLPNGYNYTPVFTTNSRQVGLADIAELTGGCMLNARGEVTFYARDEAQRVALWELQLDFPGGVPTVAGSRRIVQVGETLLDGREITRISNAAINAHGSVAVILTGLREAHGKPVPAAYLERNKGGLEPLVSPGDPVPGIDGQFGSALRDIDLHDNNDVLLVGHHSHGARAHQSIFHFPGASVAGGRIVASSGDQAPHSDGRVQSFGIVDLHDGGRYVAQVGSALPGADQVNRGESGGGTLAVAGQVNQGFGGAAVLSASRGLGVGRARQSGEAFFAPRLAADGSTCHVVHVSNRHLELYFKGVKIAETGGLSPSGHVIHTMTPGDVHGRHGLCLYLLVTDAGLELCVSNGVASKTILARGDNLGGKQLETIVFSLHNQQSDDQGRLVLVAEYTDGTHGLVVGVPV